MKKETYEKLHKQIIISLTIAEDNNNYAKMEELTRELLELENMFYGC